MDVRHVTYQGYDYDGVGERLFANLRHLPRRSGSIGKHAAMPRVYGYRGELTELLWEL